MTERWVFVVAMSAALTAGYLLGYTAPNRHKCPTYYVSVSEDAGPTAHVHVEVSRPGGPVTDLIIPGQRPITFTLSPEVLHNGR